MEHCPNAFCLKDLSAKRSKGYFLELDAISQVRHMFTSPDFVRCLETSRKRTKENVNNFEDIYDGKVYRNLSENGGPLSNRYPYNLSFTLNTDGIPVFSSSKMSLWPIYLMINELPYYKRRQAKNDTLWFMVWVKQAIYGLFFCTSASIFTRG